MNIWKEIGINRYEASEDGQIRNGKTGKVLKPKKTKNGYLQVCLCKDGKGKMFYVHRLVYEAFNGPIPDGMVTDHLDAVKTNNNLSNLRCCTQRENVSNPITKPRHVEALRNKSPEWRKNQAEAVRKACSKSIVQINKTTGETIKRWECMHDIERELGINEANISKCCIGQRKSAGGYRWKYVP